MAEVFNVEITFISRANGEVKENYSCDTFDTAITLINRYLEKEKGIYGKAIYGEVTKETELPIIINLNSFDVLEIRVFEDEIVTMDTLLNFID